MPEQILEVSALAPLHFGDGRPFAASEGNETHARSLLMPLPSSFAGFVRTQYARGSGLNLGNLEVLRQLHGLPVYGPVLFLDGQSYFPAPLDAIYSSDNPGSPAKRLRPVKQGAGGTDLPQGMLPLKPAQAVKAGPGPALWSRREIEKWLIGNGSVSPKEAEPAEEIRVHVKINPERRSAEDGMLYSVAYRNLAAHVSRDEIKIWTLRGRVKLPAGAAVEELGFLGGERRPVHLRLLDGLSEHWWDVPERIKQTFEQGELFARGNKLVRMVLVTPALFSGGWKPGWIERSGTGEKHLPRGLAKVRLRLVAAAVGRRQPVSGWSLRENRPKPVRWAVPAGSVYFFEVEDGDPAAVLESWLRPISDEEQDRKDGFGLAVWGVGSYASNS